MRLHNNHPEYAFRDLFTKRVAHISIDMKIDIYIQAFCGNWDNYNLDNIVDLDNKNKDHKNKNIKRRSSEDPNELYSIYN